MPSSLNGTGVTFNDGSTLQSGNIPTANMGSGTANSTTFLRGDRTFATVPSSAPSTDQVLNATAGASAGAVGTYAFLGWAGGNVTSTISAGSTLAGSSLRFAGLIRTGDWATSTTFGSVSSLVAGGPAGGAVSGTWRCMGQNNQQLGSDYQTRWSGVTLWLRIS